jgi:solute carrier family 12 sodium/potassium/chloride transporter 2
MSLADMMAKGPSEEAEPAAEGGLNIHMAVELTDVTDATSDKSASDTKQETKAVMKKGISFAEDVEEIEAAEDLTPQERQFLEKKLGLQVFDKMSGLTDSENTTSANFQTLLLNNQGVRGRGRGSFIKTRFNDEEDSEKEGEEGDEDSALIKDSPDKPKSSKFGTWDGVFVSCLLNIFGVIMFLRLPWVVGQNGIWLACLTIILAEFVCFITALSMSAIATNGEVKAGGAYYMISRAIGPSIGGSIGVLFTIGNGVAVALYIIGFCELLTDNLGPDVMTGDTINDIRIFGMVLLIIILVMALIGVGWVIKMNLVLFALLSFAILTFLIGSFLDPDYSVGFYGFSENVPVFDASDPEYEWPLKYPNNPFRNGGFVSQDEGGLSANGGSDYREESGITYDFFTVFAVFFPAVTGIMAGANISGDLKNPSENIPTGTLGAIGFSTVVYLIMAIVAGSVGDRETLINDKLFMANVSFIPELVFAGIYAATFSSALASLVGGPRILQAVAADNLLPFLKPFAKVSERNGDPVRGYFVVFIIAALCIGVGELNLIAPLISMFFLMTYALINFSCFEMERAKTPGWRPSFKYFTWWTALLGALLCLVAMFLTSVVYAIGASIIGIGLFKYIEYTDPDVDWGSAIDAMKEMSVVQKLLDLKGASSNIKNFRPNYLIFSRNLRMNRSNAIRFGSTLRYGYGATIYANVVIGKFQDHAVLRRYLRRYRKNEGSGYIVERVQKSKSGDDISGFGMSALMPELDEDVDIMRLPSAANVVEDDGSHSDVIHKKTGFLDATIAPNFRMGVQSLLQSSGLGQVRPNTCLFGYLDDWNKDVHASDDGKTQQDSDSDEEADDDRLANYVGAIRDCFTFNMHTCVVRGLEKVDWNKRQDVGSIDVWWLIDDGGMTVLMTYLLSQSKFWRGHSDTPLKIRLFCLAGDESEIERDQEEVQGLMNKFRFYWDVEIIVLQDAPSKESLLQYDHLIAKTPLAEQPEQNRARVIKYLRISDAVQKYSRAAKLVVMTLPVPRSRTDPYDYMSWLEILSSGMHVPLLFVRGNGDNVLTARLE